MNPTSYLDLPSHHAAAAAPRFLPGTEPVAELKRRALERCKNEGGRVPGLAGPRPGPIRGFGRPFWGWPEHDRGARASDPGFGRRAVARG